MSSAAVVIGALGLITTQLVFTGHPFTIVSHFGFPWFILDTYSSFLDIKCFVLWYQNKIESLKLFLDKQFCFWSYKNHGYPIFIHLNQYGHPIFILISLYPNFNLQISKLEWTNQMKIIFPSTYFVGLIITGHPFELIKKLHCKQCRSRWGGSTWTTSSGSTLFTL